MTRKPSRRRKRLAVLERADLDRIRAAARELGPLHHAIVEWLYTNGARASEPGIARLSDVDLHTGTVQLAHLKGGLAPGPVFLSERCRAALREWIPQRPVLNTEQREYVFPSKNPQRCYPCQGNRTVEKKNRKDGTTSTVPCPHCHGLGTRYGLTRHEVRHLVVAVMKHAGIPPEFHFPHILRHSAVTHMLDAGSQPPAIQERVGHKALTTTFGYMKTTRAARAAVTKAFDEDES